MMSYALILILVIGAVTQLLRFLPFLVFSKNTPRSILYLGDVLPYSIMAMLVVYCLKDMNLLSADHGLPEIISVLIVGVLHKWKHNTLISIIVGTLCYMVLVQFIFIG